MNRKKRNNPMTKIEKDGMDNNDREHTSKKVTIEYHETSVLLRVALCIFQFLFQ